MKIRKGWKWLTLPIVAVLLVATLALSACSSTPTSTPTPTPTPATPTPTPTQTANLNGAGATFPALLYTKWFDVYNKLTGVKINYNPIGSGGGISQITAGTVDFGASDGIMTDAQQAKAEAAFGPILHIPMTMGAVAIIYNVTGVGNETLKFTGDVLANIFLKKITRWNDPAITALNPGLTLPDAPITVVHRSDGSGTTFIFTNYLSDVSADWSTQVGNGTSVNWPGDVGAAQSGGVTAQVQQLPNSIGYVELEYALQNNLSFAQLKNSSGNYITPSLASTSAAAVGVTLPDNMKVLLTNSANPDAYPIAGFTWILVYQNQTDKTKGQTLVNMLWWAIHDGQQYCSALSYAPLPSAAVTKAENEIKSINYQGQPLLSS